MKKAFYILCAVLLITLMTDCSRKKSGTFQGAREGAPKESPAPAAIRMNQEMLFAFDISSNKLFYRVLDDPIAGPEISGKYVIYQGKGNKGKFSCIYGWNVETGSVKKIYETSSKKSPVVINGRNGLLAWFHKEFNPPAAITCYDIENKTLTNLDFDLAPDLNTKKLDIEGDYVAAAIEGRLVVFQRSTGRYREIETVGHTYRIGLSGDVAVYAIYEKNNKRLALLNLESGEIREVPVEKAGTFSKLVTGANKVAWKVEEHDDRANASIILFDIPTCTMREFSPGVWMGAIQLIQLGGDYLTWMHNNGSELYAYEIDTGKKIAIHEIIKPFLDALVIEDPHDFAKKLGPDARTTFQMDHSSLRQDGNLIAWRGRPLVRVPVKKAPGE